MESCADEDADGEGEAKRTGSKVEAAVEGLMSWLGEGWRLMEADWMVDVIVAAALSAMTRSSTIELNRGVVAGNLWTWAR